MKIFDKVLKFLKTDRNTFFTFIFSLLTVYILVDRVVEILLMIFTGMSVSYWDPILYTLAIACPVFAFLFSGHSKFITNDNMKITFFDTYVISTFIIAMSMFVQWANYAGWALFLSVPNYTGIVQNFSFLIKPAFTGLALLIPLGTFYPFMKYVLFDINDVTPVTDSIKDYGGIDLSNKKSATGNYAADIKFSTEKEDGRSVKLLEDKRFDHLLISGVTGTGKTLLVVEPMIAKDIDKKNFYRGVSKDLAIAALKNGIATLNVPYTDEYINKNFSLSMLSPVEEKQDQFDKFFSKLILSESAGKYSYRDLGITYMNSDVESINRMKAVADSYNIPVNIVDPANPNSIGLNPFIYDDPLQSAMAISNTLKGLQSINGDGVKIAYTEAAATQALENTCILLKEMYPRMHSDNLPTLQDLMDCLQDFTLVEKLCNKLTEDEDLAERYESLLKYFRNNFFAGSSGHDDTKKYVQKTVAELDNLLRYPGVKEILCNRQHNLNYDYALQNGEVTLVCTRRGELGPTIHKTFGLFFLLLMQFSVLKRPGTEKSRMPHFLYIDGFVDYVGPATDAIFEVYRKYKVGAIVTVQGLAQLGEETSKRRQAILANCANKIAFGNGVPEDNEWWSKELGTKTKFEFGRDYDMEKGEYTSTAKSIDFKFVDKYKPGKIQSLGFKQCFFKFKTASGGNDVGVAKLDFLPASYTAPKKMKNYEFNRYSIGSAEYQAQSHEQAQYENAVKKHRAIRKTFHFKDDIPGEVNPVQTDVSDSKFQFDNEDAIIRPGLRNKKNS